MVVFMPDPREYVNLTRPVRIGMMELINYYPLSINLNIRLLKLNESKVSEIKLINLNKKAFHPDDLKAA